MYRPVIIGRNVTHALGIYTFCHVLTTFSYDTARITKVSVGSARDDNVPQMS